MLIKRCRRGQVKLPVEFIIELFIIGVVAFAFLSKVVEISNGDVFEKQYISRDLGLLVDSVYAAPGSLTYSYSSFNNNFTASIKKNLVSISTKGKPGSFVRFPYVDDTNITTSSEKATFDNTSVSFFKSDNSLFISSKPADSFDLQCSDALSFNKHQRVGSVLVDPSYSGKFPGRVSDKFKESYVTFFISQILVPKLSASLSRSDDVVFLSTQRRITLSKNKDLSLTLIASSSNDVDVFVRSDSLSDKRLACYLINKLSEVNGLEKGSIKVIDDLDKDNKEFVSGSKSKLAVAVSIGSLDSFDFSGKNMNDIAEKIDHAVGGYNG